jgi:hypothetical protein
MESLNEVKKDITNAALRLDAMDKADVKKKIQKKIIEEKSLNNFADLDTFAPLSDRTVYKYIKDMGVSEREGKSKPISRVEPFLNIRNNTRTKYIRRQSKYQNNNGTQP